MVVGVPHGLLCVPLGHPTLGDAKMGWLVG